MVATSHTVAVGGSRGVSAAHVVWAIAALLAVLVLLTLSVVVAHASTLVASNPDTINVDAQAAQVAVPATYSRQVSADAAAVSAGDARAAGFQVDDDQTVWGTTTAVDLFKTEYASPDGAAVTVRSQAGEKVVAPGTSNTYTFAVRNTGEVPMDYQMTANVERGGSDDVPLELTLVGPDGTALGAMGQQGTLAPGASAQYALRWEWPFDRGADATDTQLGQAALSQQLSYTVTINTLAATAVDAGADASASGSGAQGPASWLTQTGDPIARTAMVLAAVAALAACAAVAAFARKRKFRAQGAGCAAANAEPRAGERRAQAADAPASPTNAGDSRSFSPTASTGDVAACERSQERRG